MNGHKESEPLNLTKIDWHVVGDGFEVRIFDGPTDGYGRLEVFHDGIWGSVCDAEFDMMDAHGACRSVGYM